MDQYLIAHIEHTTKQSEHICWWRPDSRGYTICIDKAGRYSEEAARRICQIPLCIAVPEDIPAALVRGTPYYRKPDGNLAKLYDGGPHRVIPNLRPEWEDLFDARLEGCAKPIKVTPIGRKARAIYLDDRMANLEHLRALAEEVRRFGDGKAGVI